MTSSLAHLSGPLLLLVVVLGLAVEAGLLVGAFVPGTAVALGAGALAEQVGLPLPAVTVAAAAGAVLGGQLGYRLGRRRAACAVPFAGLGWALPWVWSQAGELLRRRPALAVAVGQWASYGRVIVPRASGWTSAPGPGRFAAIQSASATTWAATLTTVGHYGGEAVRDGVSLALGLPVLVVVVAVLAVLGLRARRARPCTTSATEHR